MAAKKDKAAKVKAPETAGTPEDTSKIKEAAAKQEAKEAADKAKADAAEKAKAAKVIADKAKADAAEKAKAAKEAAKAAKADAAVKAKAAKDAAKAEAQKTLDAAKAIADKAKADLKAAKDAARAAGGGGGTGGKGTEALRNAAPNYHRDTEKKTAGGNVSVDSDDETAQKLRGKTLDEVYVVAAKTLKGEEGATEAELRERYGHLNVGMQRMNLGNRIRGVLNAK